MSRKKRENKEKVIQTCCSMKEYEQIKVLAEKNDMNISKYTRIMLFEDTKISKNSISILVKLQDICEYINAKQKAPDKKLERMLDDVWKSLS
ncbi:MAG: hypothetical protein J6A92_04430 [Lachnospiraceae bacterium]|nr:hypothetical protein [Lachnospiraceae bacterium]